MNIKKFSDAMNEIDDKYIEEAVSYKKEAKRSVRVKWAEAACIVVAASVALVSGAMLLNRHSAGLHENTEETTGGVPDDSMAGAADGAESSVQDSSTPKIIYIDADNIAVNEIENYGSGDIARYDADTDTEILWDIDDIIEYFGRDIAPLYIPDSLTASEKNGTARVYENPDGSLSEDTVYFQFYSGYYEDGSPELTDDIQAKKGFSIIASKIGIPRDCVYVSHDNGVKVSDIAGTEVIFGHYSAAYGPYDEETNEPTGYYDMYTAEFELDGAEYQIVADQMDFDEVVKITASFITGEINIEID